MSKLTEDASIGATSSGSIATVIGGKPSNYYNKPPKPKVTSQKEVLDTMIKRLASESSISLEEKRQMLESWLDVNQTPKKLSNKPSVVSRYTASLENELNTLFENITTIK